MTTPFQFARREAVGSYILSLNLPVPLYRRLEAAAKAQQKKEKYLDTQQGRKRTSATVQEVARQMLDHCLKDTGF